MALRVLSAASMALREADRESSEAARFSEPSPGDVVNSCPTAGSTSGQEGVARAKASCTKLHNLDPTHKVLQLLFNTLQSV
jgi:hypothetical protein